MQQETQRCPRATQVTPVARPSTPRLAALRARTTRMTHVWLSSTTYTSSPNNNPPLAWRRVGARGAASPAGHLPRSRQAGRCTPTPLPILPSDSGAPTRSRGTPRRRGSSRRRSRRRGRGYCGAGDRSPHGSATAGCSQSRLSTVSPRGTETDAAATCAEAVTDDGGEGSRAPAAAPART